MRRKGIYFHMGFTTKSELRKELERGSTDRFYLRLKVINVLDLTSLNQQNRNENAIQNLVLI